MLQLLRTRRWAGFTVLVAVLIIAFGLLSRWQWQRAEDRRTDRLTMEAAAVAPPAILETNSSPAAWASVTATGEYLPADQLLVRRRPMDAVNGFWVMTPLRLQDGQITWVNRGWLAAQGPATTMPAVPPAPTGQVVVTGIWRDLAVGDRVGGLPAGMITAPSAAELAPASPFDGYLQRASSQPDDPLVPIPRETVDEGRNVSYAVQWILFAAISILGWGIFLRREAREDARIRHEAESAGSAPATVSTSN